MVKDKSRYSKASKERWRDVDVADRKRIMSQLARKRYKKMNPEQKATHISKMNDARLKKMKLSAVTTVNLRRRA